MLDPYFNDFKYTKILDIGCGTGHHVNLLNKRYGYKIYGIDKSDDMIEQIGHISERMEELCGNSFTKSAKDAAILRVLQTKDINFNLVHSWITKTQIKSGAEALLDDLAPQLSRLLARPSSCRTPRPRRSTARLPSFPWSKTPSRFPTRPTSLRTHMCKPCPESLARSASSTRQGSAATTMAPTAAPPWAR